MPPRSARFFAPEPRVGLFFAALAATAWTARGTPHRADPA
jgi:hypothetical protein